MKYLINIREDGDLLGVSWIRTVYNIVDYFKKVHAILKDR